MCSTIFTSFAVLVSVAPLMGITVAWDVARLQSEEPLMLILAATWPPARGIIIGSHYHPKMSSKSRKPRRFRWIYFSLQKWILFFYILWLHVTLLEFIHLFYFSVKCRFYLLDPLLLHGRADAFFDKNCTCWFSSCIICRDNSFLRTYFIFQCTVLCVTWEMSEFDISALREAFILLHPVVFNIQL